MYAACILGIGLASDLLKREGGVNGGGGGQCWVGIVN